MSVTEKEIKNRKPRWKRRPDHRPEEIAVAALDIFAERGFEAATMDEIAAKSGVSKGTIYLYYPSKEDLLVTAVEYRVRANQKMVLPLIQLGAAGSGEKFTPSGVKQILTEVVTRIADLLSKPETQKAIRVVMAERARIRRLREKQVELAGFALAALTAFLRKAASDGAIHCPNPDVIAKALFGINFTAILMNEILGKGKFAKIPDEDRDAILDFTFRGLGLS